MKRRFTMQLRLVSLALVLATAAAQGTPRPYTELLESKPVRVNGAEFVALAEAEWVAFNPPHGRDPIQVQLRITNRSDKELIFPTFDTFRVIIRTGEGKEILPDGGRDITLRGAKSVLVRPGSSYCLCRSAELRWNADGKSRTFVYSDGTGSVFTFGPLKAGKYRLSFRYENAEERAAVQRKAMDGHQVWSGKAVTKEVLFEVVDP